MCLFKDHIAYSYEAPAYIDSDSQSSSSQYQEYQDSPSPLSDRGGREDRHSLPLAPLSGINYTQYQLTPNLYVFSVKSTVVEKNMHVHTHTNMYESLWPHIYIPFFLGRKEEGAIVPVPVWDASDTIDAELYLVGPFLQWYLSVLFPKQGASGTAVGPTKGKSQAHDLPEDGTSTEELLPHWRDSESEEEAHVSV